MDFRSGRVLRIEHRRNFYYGDPDSFRTIRCRTRQDALYAHRHIRFKSLTIYFAMSHNELNDRAAKSNDPGHKQQENLLDNQGLILNAVLMLLSDVCLTRFELLMTTDQDPLEAAREVIESLDRYDFLGDLVVSKTGYLEQKKRIGSTISNEVERVIQEQNPR